jgi:hypothetical protein
MFRTLDHTNATQRPTADKTAQELGKIDGQRADMANAMESWQFIGEHLRSKGGNLAGCGSDLLGRLADFGKFLGEKSGNSNEADGGLCVNNNKIFFKGLTIELLKDSQMLVHYRGAAEQADVQMGEFHKAIENRCSSSGEFSVVDEGDSQWIKDGNRKIFKLPAKDFFNKSAIFKVENGGNNPSLHENEFAKGLKDFVGQIDEVSTKAEEAAAGLWNEFENLIKGAPAVAAQPVLGAASDAIGQFKDRLKSGAKELMKRELSKLALVQPEQASGDSDNSPSESSAPPEQVSVNSQLESPATPSSAGSQPENLATREQVLDNSDNSPSESSIPSSSPLVAMNLPLWRAATDVGAALKSAKPAAPTEFGTSAAPSAFEAFIGLAKNALDAALKVLSGIRGNSERRKDMAEQPQEGKKEPERKAEERKEEELELRRKEEELARKTEELGRLLQRNKELAGAMIVCNEAVKAGEKELGRSDLGLAEEVCAEVIVGEARKAFCELEKECACVSAKNDNDGGMNVSSVRTDGNLSGNMQGIIDSVKRAHDGEEEQLRAKIRELEAEVSRLREEREAAQRKLEEEREKEQERLRVGRKEAEEILNNNIIFVLAKRPPVEIRNFVRGDYECDPGLIDIDFNNV